MDIYHWEGWGNWAQAKVCTHRRVLLLHARDMQSSFLLSVAAADCTYTTRQRQLHHPPQAHGFMQHTYTSLPLNSLPSPRTSASLGAWVKWSQSAAHPWLANSEIGTGINSLCGWNSTLEFRSWVQSQLLLIFSCHHFTLGCDVLQHSRIKCHCHT